ncbi:hypothetical protein [Streptomyces sp. CC224B]|uniref:hypothetical protein n=1 Tax=Streptomyces sp. CC224B TaxID=3044571 RepID=UPI0024A93152|nr:hypothetical protein [Streptomyces sp. CC224B]
MTHTKRITTVLCSIALSAAVLGGTAAAAEPPPRDPKPVADLDDDLSPRDDDLPLRDDDPPLEDDAADMDDADDLDEAEPGPGNKQCAKKVGVKLLGIPLLDLDFPGRC